MKRIIALILMLAMSVLLLASCGLFGGNDNNGPAADFVMPEGGYDGSAITIKFYHSMGAQLQEILDLVSAAGQYLGVGNDVSSAIAQGMQEYGWEGDASTLATSLQTAIAGVMPQVGNDASAGVGQGAAAYDFSGDTATAAGNLEGAYRGSLQSQSPAQRMVPLGNDVSAGVGQGMTQYSFAGDSATAASNLMGALSGALAAQASTAAASARSIGTAITSGIASGICTLGCKSRTGNTLAICYLPG